MDLLVDDYFRSGLAPSTQRTYKSAKKRFLEFCRASESQPLPLTEQVACRYVAHLGEQGLAPKTIKAYLSAVRHLQISANMSDPDLGQMAKLEQVLKGVKREYAKKSPGKRVRLPITPDILLKLRGVWEGDSRKYDSIMLWGACCLCYFGFLRAGEIAVPSEAAYDPGEHLNAADISVDSIANPKLLKIKIKSSKTDPFRQGVEIFIGRTDNKLCPVAAVLAYLAKRGNKKGMFFQYEDGRLLTRDRFVTSVREALKVAGVDCKAYAGHSFRIGAATAAGRCGLAPATIQTLGRWESSAYLLYIRLSREELAGVSRMLSQMPGHPKPD